MDPLWAPAVLPVLGSWRLRGASCGCLLVAARRGAVAREDYGSTWAGDAVRGSLV